MKTFKQKSLYAALAGVTALGVTSAAQAVNVNPDGLGQVLIYPYYTVRDKVAGAPFSTLLTVVNSQASAKAVKVRFLEGKNSQEVLDFNLFLSAKDVWTAAILQTADGAGVGSFDKSCTIPTVGSTQDAPVVHDFVNVLLDDAVGDDSLDRTREGYAEIIEMGTIAGGSATETAVTHKAGVPPCTASALTDAAVQSAIAAPSGGLFGDLTLINVNAGEDYTADAVALDNFRNAGTYDSPGDIHPDLTQVNPPTSVVVANNAFYQSNWGNPIDAISALFMHDHVYNTFILDSGTKSGTDWVLTFPTKRYYYDADGVVSYLFLRYIDSNGGCDDVGITTYDREETSATPQVGFSPQRPGKANTLCWEANVLTFNASQVLGSTNNRNVASTYQNGWADLSFVLAPGTRGATGSYAHSLGSFSTTVTPVGGTTTGVDVSYIGLPVIGFALESYNNGTLVNNGSLVQSQYGGNFVHKGTRSIVPFGAP
jgi:hypothetical protein